VGKKAALPRTVVALGLASLLNDLSSEMVQPLVPAFLAGTLGAGPVALGLIEGAAETVSAFLKILSGLVADRGRRRKPMILGGYALAGIARPLIGIATSWPAVMLLRLSDRVGKGIRTSPRDALLADTAPAEKRGAVYAFHRAMDHTGAVLGPLVVVALLGVVPVRTTILLSALPAALVLVTLAVGVREPRHASPPSPRPFRPSELKALGPGFRRFLAATGLFILGRPADLFLLYRLFETGTALAVIALLWASHHVVRVVATIAGGRLADRFDRRAVLASGWFVYAAIFLAFARFESDGARVAIFLLYGVYYGLAEPSARALVADHAPPHLRGSAFGLFHGVEGLAALPASLLFGLLYAHLGARFAFTASAVVAGCAALLLARLPRAVSSAPA